MKSLACYLALLFAIVSCAIQPDKKTNTLHSAADSSFAKDSGYITEGNLRRLFKISPDDTLFKNRGSYTVNDTVGKYFINKAGNYVAFINIFNLDGYSDLNTFVEAQPDGTIIKEAPQWVGMYRCCWANNNDGFRKHGDYYSFPACGTGSGFCSGDLYFFKDIENIDANGSILQSVWTGTLPSIYEDYIDIDAWPEVGNDTIIMHYTQRLLKRKGEKFKVKKSESFDIMYTLQSTGWAATDSAKLNKLIEYKY